MSGELAFIEALRALATHPAARGLDDDAAVLAIGSETLILTCDMMVEGVHYLPGQDMADVAFKLVAVNVSDLAAKGAAPLGVLLGHTLGADDTRFVEGLGEALAAFDVPLLGGDTVSTSGARSHAITAIGRATHSPVPSRSGAQAGDALFLTGPLGAAMVGFERLERDIADRSAETHAFRRPRPLLAEGQALAPHVHAMMDVSDGLLLDASRMAEASGVTLAVDSGAVPLACLDERRDDALRWGDDYQLLVAAAPDLPAQLPDAPLHRIGTVQPRGEHPLLLDGASLDPADPLGYRHPSPSAD